MPTDRTAIDTITGYYYQFDYYILQLLNRENYSDLVTIEAVEDVDIHSEGGLTAVQCKYYAKTEYNHSVIAKPIRLMLKHFKDNLGKRNETYYKIYGHFKSGQSKLTIPISLDFLKSKFLCYTEKGIKHELYKDLNLLDEELQLFLSKLIININAVDFETQENEIFVKIKELLQCNEFDAQYFFYNNALRYIKNIATKQDISERKISKKQLIDTIDQKSCFFDNWFIEFRGIKEYCKAVKLQYFTSINISPYERFFLIECDQRISEAKLKALVLKIAKNWSKLSRKEPKPFCPYIYLYGITEQTIINVKKMLQNDNVYFIDGYDFKGATFNAKSMTRRASFHNEIKFKFISKLDQVETILEELDMTRLIFQFYINEPFYSCENHQVCNIKISSTENIENMI